MIRRVLVYYRPYWYLLVSDLVAVPYLIKIMVDSLIPAGDLKAIFQQRGSHEQLIGQPGLYADLYTVQHGLVTDGE